jgi:hypothetical protein
MHVHDFGKLPHNGMVLVPWYQSMYSSTYTCTCHGKHVPWSVQISLSQKRLEIQALRCKGKTGGRCQRKTARFQLNSEICRADLHHNPRKHVGLHAHHCLHRLLRTVSVVVRICGFPGVSIDTCSPGSGVLAPMVHMYVPRFVLHTCTVGTFFSYSTYTFSCCIAIAWYRLASC